jgi:hypothetical protein
MSGLLSNAADYRRRGHVSSWPVTATPESKNGRPLSHTQRTLARVAPTGTSRAMATAILHSWGAGHDR